MAPVVKHMTVPNVVTNFVDKRKALSAAADGATHNLAKSVAPFTANAGGTTTTIVGANAAPGTNDNNVVRRGEEFRLFTAAGALKEETVFTVTAIAVAGSTTVTFTPAAAVVTANTDVARFVGMTDIKDNNDLTARLSTLGYTDPQINQMTPNDMIYAIRQADNPDGI
jgi:hypothetical protein